MFWMKKKNKTIYMLNDAHYERTLVPVRIAGNWKTDHTKSWQGCGYLTDSATLLVGKLNSMDTLENSLASFLKS